MMITLFLMIAATPQITVQDANLNQNSETCRQFEVAGSRIPEKVCATQAQWSSYDAYKRQQEILAQKRPGISRPLARF